MAIDNIFFLLLKKNGHFIHKLNLCFIMDGIFQSNRLIDNKRYDDDDNDNLLKCAKTQIGIKQTHMTIDSSSKTTITIQHVIMMMMVNVTKSWYYSKIIYYLVLEQKFKKV